MTIVVWVKCFYALLLPPQNEQPIRTVKCSKSDTSLVKANCPLTDTFMFLLVRSIHVSSTHSAPAANYFSMLRQRNWLRQFMISFAFLLAEEVMRSFDLTTLPWKSGSNNRALIVVCRLSNSQKFHSLFVYVCVPTSNLALLTKLKLAHTLGYKMESN